MSATLPGSIKDLQDDWAIREQITQLTSCIQHLSQFVNQFNSTTQTRLAQLRSRVQRIEYQLSTLEQKLTIPITGIPDESCLLCCPTLFVS